jgi:hypothetical protein
VPTSNLLMPLLLLPPACNWMTTFWFIGSNGADWLAIRFRTSWTTSTMDWYSFDALMLLSTFYGNLLFTGGVAVDGPTPDSSKIFFFPTFTGRSSPLRSSTSLFHKSFLFHTACL